MKVYTTLRADAPRDQKHSTEHGIMGVLKISWNFNQMLQTMGRSNPENFSSI